MIVDDHPDMRRTLRTIVASASADDTEFVECSDGVEAVQQFPIHRPDRIVMDVQLKTMDGFTAAEKIFELDPTAQIIFVTGFPSAGARKRAEQLRARGFVSKDNLMELNALIIA